MTKGVQQRRGNTAQHAVFNGEPGEITVNTDRWAVVVQDGTTNGGYEHVNLNSTQRLSNKDIVATNLVVSGVSTFSNISVTDIRDLQVATGVATFSAPTTVLIGAATSTGTANQDLQVTGGVYVSGNTGIGTTNPGASLHIQPSATSIAGLFSGTTSGDMVRITQTGSGNALLVEDSANPDTTSFVVNNAGFVGCGTALPAAQLHVIPTTTSNAGLFSGTTSSDLVRITQLGTGNALRVDDEANGTTPFVISGFGSVGISTNSPTAKLHIGPGSAAAGTAPLEFSSGTLLTVAESGVFEYATPAAYFTPNSSERGVILTPQYFVLNADRTGPTGANQSFSIFGFSCNLSASTRYGYEINFSTTKSSANAAAVAYGIGTTSGSITHHRYTAITGTGATTGAVAAGNAAIMSGNIVNPPTNPTLAATLNTISAASAAAASAHNIQIHGVIEVGTAVVGLSPRFAYTAAPTTSNIISKSYMKIWPIGATGSDTTVGAWQSP